MLFTDEDVCKVWAMNSSKLIQYVSFSALPVNPLSDVMYDCIKKNAKKKGKGLGVS